MARVKGGKSVTFNSWEFLLFYPIVLLLYFVLPKKARWPMLLIASYFFYMCYQTELVFLIFGTTLISWISSRVIERTEKKSLKVLFLTLTLLVSLGALFFYKYFNFLAGTVFDIAAALGSDASPITLQLVLPVGISFYTFQTLSYVIDVYRGEVKSENNFFFYALFVSFFPQLVAGPIERPSNLMPQLREAHPWSNKNAIAGAKMMMLGFFKKICVADFVSGFVDAVYNSPDEATSLGVIIATLLFAVQIYCDFSGYTDIAIGCSRIMGIRLMKNFDAPYSATSIREFWSRWHISLSTWFKDYLYIPLGGNRVSLPRNLINLFIVFLVSGLWHGAAWTFIIWGALHGIYQIIGKLTIKGRNRLLSRIGLSENSKGVIYARRVITFLLVCFAWLIFRANSIGDAVILLGKLFSGLEFTKTVELMGLDLVSVLLAVSAIALLILLDRAVTYDGKEVSSSSRITVRAGAYVYLVSLIILFWLLLLSKDMISTFIYFQF